jgi:hypothetical protein
VPGELVDRRRGTDFATKRHVSTFFCYLSLTQGFYFLATGLWPIVDIASFLKVTGPKRDIWLVKTVAVLVCAIAVPLIIAGLNDRGTPEIVILGAGSAAVLMGIDVWYVSRKVIPPIYLCDALVEAIIIGCWTYVWITFEPLAA